MAIDTAWLDQQVRDFTGLLPSLNIYARILRAALAIGRDAVCPTAHVETRVKTIPSFAGKCVRKYDRLHAGGGALRQLTDLCGGRVVVQLGGQVEQLCRFVRENFIVDEANSLDTFIRLRTDQFGYRSVHYVIQIRADRLQALGLLSSGEFTRRDVAAIEGLKAEIQLRTIAQHVWAEAMHDRVYKTPFQVPAEYQRQSAAIAAMLEQVDGSLGDLTRRMDNLYANVSAYKSDDETRDEIGRLEAILRHDPLNAGLTAELARRRIALGQFPEAAASVDAYAWHHPGGVRMLPAELLTCQGRAICLQHQNSPAGKEYQRGQDLLQQACARDPRSLEAAAARAESWVGVDEPAALQAFEAAFKIDPHDPLVLGGYLRHRLAAEAQPRTLALFAPNIHAAAARCREQILVRVNLPHALFLLAEFELLLQSAAQGREEQGCRGLAALCRGMSLCRCDPGILAAVARRFELWARSLPGFYGMAAHGKFFFWGSGPAQGLAQPPASPLRPPVVIVAGGHGRASELAEYNQVLKQVLSDFGGTVVSLSEGARDDRDSELNHGTGALKAWSDILAGGIHPRDVTVIGMGEEEPAQLLYQLAAALGAKVAIVTPLAGRGTATSALDRELPGNERIFSFPMDAETLRALIAHPPASAFDPNQIHEIAGAIDRAFFDALQRKEAEERRHAVACNERLALSFDKANHRQALHICEKLRRIGRQAVPAPSATPTIARLTPREIELLAEIEHGRWVADRVLDGWRYGPKRDDVRFERPQLVPWADLPLEEREKDFETVRRIPEYLASIGYEIAPLSPSA